MGRSSRVRASFLQFARTHGYRREELIRLLGEPVPGRRVVDDYSRDPERESRVALDAVPAIQATPAMQLHVRSCA
jgi:hypothetical protein